MNNDARPARYSNNVMGHAANKIVSGALDPERLPDLIERCHACNNVLGRCYSGQPECWHLAARLLLEQGLKPGRTTTAESRPTNQMSISDVARAVLPEREFKQTFDAVRRDA